MKEDYFNYYILSYFDVEKVVRLSQVLHVLRGKRTPSMFYITEINNWHHGFSIESFIEREELMNIINSLLRNKLLIDKEKGYLLTVKGEKISKNYFENHYYPNKITGFSSLNLHRPFWDRIQLFTQVFSEHSYQNAHYLPIIKNPIHQENVRQLFQLANGNIESVFDQWVKEQEFIFKNMEEKKAGILLKFLTGYNKIGKTRVQVAKELHMKDYEFKLYLRDILQETIEYIKINSKKLPLTYEILTQTNEENYLSLSGSTYQSYKLLEQGYGIKQIALKRHLKENTVKEHLLEIAFIVDQFPAGKFVPEKIYNDLYKQFENKEQYSFKNALSDFEELEFYHYRLVELERMRLS